MSDTESEPELRASKRSTFLITINTNFKPQTTQQAKACAQALEAAIGRVFGGEALGQCVRFLPDKTGRLGSFDDVVKITTEAVVELGTSTKGGRVHAHVVLTAHHTALMQINAPGVADAITATGLLRKWLRGKMYVNVKYVPDALSQVKRYIYKTVDGWADEDGADVDD